MQLSRDNCRLTWGSKRVAVQSPMSRHLCSFESGTARRSSSTGTPSQIEGQARIIRSKNQVWITSAPIQSGPLLFLRSAILSVAVNQDDAVAERFHLLYEGVLGPCDFVFHVPREQKKDGFPHVDVHVYRRPGPFDVLLTAGMSTLKQGSDEYPTKRERVELYTKIPSKLPDETVGEICRGLWRLAQWPFGSSPRRFLAEWHIVHGMPPLVERSLLNAFFLTAPSASDSFIANLAPVVGVPFCHAYGITDGERLQLERQQMSDLPLFGLSLFRAAGHVTDPSRNEIDLEELGIGATRH